MIQTYNDILQEIQSFNRCIGDSSQIQKIYSSAYYICLQIRSPGKTNFLILGRGHGHEGIWTAEKQIESGLRKIDRYLEYLRKYLSASVLHRIDIDSDDRIIRLTYRRFGRVNRIMFFYCGRELYFVNRYYNESKDIDEVFYSWKRKEIDDKTLEDFECFDDIGRKDIEDKTQKSAGVGFSKLIKEEAKKAYNDQTSSKNLKFLKRKEVNIKKDLEKISIREYLLELVNSDRNFGDLPTKNNFSGIKLNFKQKEHYQRRDEIFQKIKKLNKADEILKLRLRDTQDRLAGIDKNVLKKSVLKVIQPIWKNKNSNVKTTENTKKEYKIYKVDGFDLGVGNTARGNDKLRSEWAKKSDIWFHLDNVRSPHVIVKMGDKVLDESIFKIIAAAMKKFAKIESDGVLLVYTQVKNLKSVKGAPGKVILKKEKRIKTYVENSWDQFISDTD